MSRASEAASFLDGISELSSQQWVLRALVLTAPFVALAAASRAGAAGRTWVVVLLALMIVLSALLPDSHAPLAVVLLTGGYWGMAVDENLSWWLPVAAVALLVFHVACLLSSYGPPSVVLDRVLLRRWLARAGLAGAVTVLVWVAARVVAGLDPARSGWLLAAALLVVLGWTAVLSRKLVGAAG